MPWKFDKEEHEFWEIDDKQKFQFNGGWVTTLKKKLTYLNLDSAKEFLNKSTSFKNLAKNHKEKKKKEIRIENKKNTSIDGELWLEMMS